MLDVAPGSTQGQVSIVAWRQYVLVAWNDGEFRRGSRLVARALFA